MRKLRTILMAVILALMMSNTMVFAQSDGQDSVAEIVAKIAQADAAIQTVQTQVDATNAEINALNGELETKQAELDVATEALAVKQRSVNERIRAIYMYGGDSYLEFLFTSETLTDLIDKADLIASVMQADQREITSVRTVKEEVESTTQELSRQKAALESTQREQEALMATQQEIKNQQSTLLAENTTIVQAAQAEIAAGGGGSTSGNSTQTANAFDFDVICAIVAHEGGTSYEGSLAVISCVMNRADSGAWGGSDALSVLTAPGQFASYLDGYYTQYLGADIPEVRQAVTDCMEGGVRSHGYTSFRSYETSGSVNICGNWYF